MNRHVFIKNALTVVGAAALLGAGCLAYQRAACHFSSPLDTLVDAFFEASSDERLAEECLTNTKIDSSALESVATPNSAEPPVKASSTEEEARIMSEVCEAERSGIVFGDMPAVELDSIVFGEFPPVYSCKVAVEVDEAVGSGGEVLVSQDIIDAPTSRVTGSPAAAVGAAVADATPALEARETRRVQKDVTQVYARRVYDACKAKFGTPKNTEANYRAVWRFAQTVMKDHGLRPSHQAALLPVVVANTFIPSLDEMVAQRNVGVLKRMIEGAFEDQLSTWEKWAARLRRITSRC
jgi:hypothetical protein